MTNEEAIERIKVIRWEHATNKCPDREALDIATKALKILSTVTEAKFHDMSDSPMLQYKKGWNDALDAVKIKFESEEEYEL